MILDLKTKGLNTLLYYSWLINHNKRIMAKIYKGDKMENQQEIKHGEKTIKLVISFFANDLPNKKMIWQHGMVRAMTNRSRGIRKGTDDVSKSEMFNKMDELPTAISNVLKKCEVVIVEHNKSTKKLQIVDY